MVYVSVPPDPPRFRSFHLLFRWCTDSRFSSVSVFLPVLIFFVLAKSILWQAWTFEFDYLVIFFLDILWICFVHAEPYQPVPTFGYGFLGMSYYDEPSHLTYARIQRCKFLFRYVFLDMFYLRRTFYVRQTSYATDVRIWLSEDFLIFFFWICFSGYVVPDMSFLYAKSVLSNEKSRNWSLI